jgi:hypothetical protein
MLESVEGPAEPMREEPHLLAKLPKPLFVRLQHHRKPNTI